MTHRLIYFGDPRFRQRAEPVEEVNDDVKALIDDVIFAMDEHKAIGLSAVHVGVLLRLVVVRLDPSHPPVVYINPKLSDPSPETETGEEGSVSWPGVRAQIERPISITVTALDRDGNPITERLSGLFARVVMHENDQLNGVLFIDRAKGRERDRLRRQYKNEAAG